MVLFPVGLKADDCECVCESDIEVVIAKEAIRQHFSVDLAIAVAKTESNLNPYARGKNGEIGLFQVLPRNAPRVALFDPKSNARVAVAILKDYQRQCRDMGRYFVICYNQGAKKRPKYPKLHPYYKKVQSFLGSYA